MTIAMTGGRASPAAPPLNSSSAEPAAGHAVLTTGRPETLSDLAARGADVRFEDFDQPDSRPAA